MSIDVVHYRTIIFSLETAPLSAAGQLSVVVFKNNLETVHCPVEGISCIFGGNVGSGIYP